MSAARFPLLPLCWALWVTAAQAQAPLAATADVIVPGGEAVHISLPPGSCSFPDQVRERAARFLAEGEHGVLLLLATGDCADMGQLGQGRTGSIHRSTQLAMHKEEADRKPRSSPAAYRRSCFEQFPKKRESLDSQAVRQELKEADEKMDLGGQAGLGLLAATREAVFGGTLTEVSRPPLHVLLVQVTACWDPGSAPLLWMFQESVDRDAGEGAVLQALREQLAMAQAQVKASGDLNRSAASRP